MKKENQISVKVADYCSIVPKEVFEDERLGAYEVLGYTVVRSFGATCWASYTSIGKRMRCSRRQAIRVVQSLVDLGYIKKDIQGEGNVLTVFSKVVTESHQLPSVTPLVTESHPASDSQSPKTDKLNREYKQISDGLDEEAERIYKLYPAKTIGRPRVAKSRKNDTRRIRQLLKRGYPVEKAIREIALKTDYPKDLKSFLHENNLPDVEELETVGRSAQAPSGAEVRCHHEMDWNKAEPMGFGQFKGPCKICGSRIMRPGGLR